MKNTILILIMLLFVPALVLAGGPPFSGSDCVKDCTFKGDSTFQDDLAVTGTLNLGGVTPVAGTRLLLPSENDGSTPTLAFGDGKDGFYSTGSRIIKVALNGDFRWTFTINLFLSSNANGAGLRNTTASSTVPTINPDRSDINSGLGGDGNDTTSLIAGGVEGLRVVEGAEGATGTFLFIPNLKNKLPAFHNIWEIQIYLEGIAKVL